MLKISRCLLVVVVAEFAASWAFTTPVQAADVRKPLPLQLEPLNRAADYVVRAKIDISKHDLSKMGMSNYCPPQPTVYRWYVTIPAADGKGKPIVVAVPKKGMPWQLDPQTLQRIPSKQIMLRLPIRLPTEENDDKR